MTILFAFTYLLLWLLVAALTLAVLVLGRQIGLLHRRLPPSGAQMLNAGPDVGQLVPALSASDLDGRQLTVGGSSPKPTLVVFVSPGCHGCREIAPAIRSLARTESASLQIYLASLMEDEAANRAFVRTHGLENLPFVASTTVIDVFGVTGSPYAVLLDTRGSVVTKGVVNSLEQLGSLLDAAELGFATIQAYAKSRNAGFRHAGREDPTNQKLMNHA
jgi:methylamine dehydrogenase accessory protein MauD